MPLTNKVNNFLKFKNLDQPKFNNTVKFYAQTIKEEIGFINFIFDSYEGIGNIRTVDEHSGLLEFWISPYFIEEAKEIFAEFERKINFKLIPEKDITIKQKADN